MVTIAPVTAFKAFIYHIFENFFIGFGFMMIMFVFSSRSCSRRAGAAGTLLLLGVGVPPLCSRLRACDAALVASVAFRHRSVGTTLAGELPEFASAAQPAGRQPCNWRSRLAAGLLAFRLFE